jgi:xanthine dehydrogenase accessory factor
MRDLFRTLQTSLQAARPTAYCRLVETRGSTPQKAGALMLVYADGSQAGTLGGGCVEAEVKRQALARLHAGRPEIATFQLDSDYGWDDGLICGGRMKVLIEPLVQPTAAVRHYFGELSRRVEAGQGVTEAVVFDAAVSGQAAPSLYLFGAQQELVAALPAERAGTPPPANDAPPDHSVPPLVQGQLRNLADRPRAYAGQGVAYLPILPRCRLVIVGGGHVGQAVAALAAQLDFVVWVVDDRPDVVSEERFPQAERRIAGDIGRVLPDLEITPDTYCLIVTRGHNHDEEALFHLAERGACYVGLIGSRRKIKLIFEDLLEQGISREALARVYAPLGIDIGSQTVAEIAVSICAELVAHRNRGEVPGRPQPVLP